MTQNQIHQNSIDDAIALIKPIAEQYNPKQKPMYFEYINKEGHIMPFGEDQETYCEDCIEGRKKEIENWENKRMPDDFYSLSAVEESSREGIDFTVCNVCGHLIECSIIFTHQEYEHWLSMGMLQFRTQALIPYSCYELKKILEDRNDDFILERSQIALKLLGKLI